MIRSNPPALPTAHGPLSVRDDSSSPLALAYAAYQRTAPSEREVSSAVARVRTRLRGKRRRVRVGSLMAFAVVFVGALAYAAGALGERPLGGLGLKRGTPDPVAVSGAAPTRPTLARERRPETPAVVRSDRAPVALATDPAQRTLSSVSEGSPLTEPLARGAARERSRSSASSSVARGTPERGGAAWAVVAESMASKDYARAESALRELAKSDASDTRNKATLGMAQLALGRGDCVEARRLAQRVLGNSPNAQARRRSDEVLTRCAAVRPSPRVTSSAGP